MYSRGEKNCMPVPYVAPMVLTRYGLIALDEKHLQTSFEFASYWPGRISSLMHHILCCMDSIAK